MEPNKAASWTYFIEFFTIPPVALLLAVFAVLDLGAIVFALIPAGMMIWSLTEYVFHRFPLHHWPYFSEQHDHHHRYPKSYVGISTIGITIIFGTAGYGLALITTAAISAGVFAGILAAYGQYISIHHMLHHYNPLSFGKRMRGLWKHHVGHHRGGIYNFGVSTLFWDRVFGTMRP